MMTPKQEKLLNHLIQYHLGSGASGSIVEAAGRYRGWLRPAERAMWDSASGEQLGRMAAWIMAEVTEQLHRCAALVDERRLTKATASVWIDYLRSGQTPNGILHLTPAQAEKFGLSVSSSEVVA